jgi:hypothetical protein
MPRIFVLKLDLEQVRRHLSREEGREFSPSEVLAWLHDAGFVRTPAGWEAPEHHLGQLWPSEVIDAQVREDD